MAKDTPVLPGDTLAICCTPDNAVIFHVHLTMTDELTIDCISPGEEATSKFWLGPQRAEVMAFMRDMRQKMGTTADKGAVALKWMSGKRVRGRSAAGEN